MRHLSIPSAGPPAKTTQEQDRRDVSGLKEGQGPPGRSNRSESGLPVEDQDACRQPRRTLAAAPSNHGPALWLVNSFRDT